MRKEACFIVHVEGSVRNSRDEDEDEDEDEDRDNGGSSSSGMPASHTDNQDGARHQPGKDEPFSNSCTSCHGIDLRGDSGPSCYSCHGREWDETGSGSAGSDSDENEETRSTMSDRRGGDHDD